MKPPSSGHNMTGTHKEPYAGDDKPVAQAVVALLDCARLALMRDVHLAGQYIADASELLRAQHELKEEGTEDAGRGTLAPWQVRRVKQLIESELANAIRIEDLAAVTRLSPSYFSYAFRRSVGETPFGYIRRCRVEHAQRLMLLTDKSLAQIALECGLADQSHLTRCFRQFVGCSPGLWRRQRRANCAAAMLLPDRIAHAFGGGGAAAG